MNISKTSVGTLSPRKQVAIIDTVENIEDRKVEPNKSDDLVPETNASERVSSLPVTPSLTNSDYNTAKSLDELLEAKMVSDIIRANNNLKQFKQFRHTSEKHYKDKFNEEMRRREIRKPLEEALLENQLLKGKVERRDEIIRALRRYILVDSLKSGTGVHSSILDFAKNEELKELQISDENDLLLKKVKAHEREVEKLREIVQQQQQTMKEYSDEIQKKDFLNQELIRKFDAEREHHQLMIEKRDQRINRLCIDLETLVREKKELEEVHKLKLREIEQCEEKITELLQQRENVQQMKADYEDKIEDLKIDLRDSREEVLIITEKLDDLQIRYDNLVVELDSMVEGGYQHADVVQLAVSPSEAMLPAGGTGPRGKGGDRDDETVGGNTVRRGGKKSTVKTEKRSSTSSKGSKATVPVSTAMKKHRDSTQSTPIIPDTLQEDSSISTATAETHKSGMAADKSIVMDNATSSKSVEEAKKQAMVNPPPRLMGSQYFTAGTRDSAISINTTKTSFISVMSSQSDHLHPNEGNSGEEIMGRSNSRSVANVSLGQSPSTQFPFSNPPDGNQFPVPTYSQRPFGSMLISESRKASLGSKFWLRKIEEDATVNEKIYANAAVRMKDQLIIQIHELEQKLQEEKLNRIKDAEAVVWKEKGQELKDQIFAAEMIRVHKELATVQNAYVKLKLELRSTRSAYYVAQQTISQLQSPIESRQQTAKKETRLGSLEYHPVTEPLLPPEYEGPREGSVLFDDDYLTQEEGSKRLDSHPISEQGSGFLNGSDYDHQNNEAEESIDYLGMIGAGESTASTVFDALISADTDIMKGIQVDDIDGFDHRRREEAVENRSIQYNMEDLPVEMHWATDSQILENEMIQRKEQLIIQAKQLNDYLQDFYENIQLVIYEFFPQQKFQLLSFDYEKHRSTWRQELEELALLPSLDLHWQVKQTLILLVTLNELRNQFVEQLFSIHPVAGSMYPVARGGGVDGVGDFNSSIQTAETFFQDHLVNTFQIQCTMIIHIIDIMIQAIHHLLAPVFHLQKSDYPDLDRVFTMIQRKHQLYDIHHPPGQGSSKLQSDIIAKYRNGTIGGTRPHRDIFPLTQANLTTDLGYGIRRASLAQSLIQNASPPRGRKGEYYPPAYMNRSSSPRRLPAYIDQFLDRIEGRNASRSSSPKRNIVEQGLDGEREKRKSPSPVGGKTEERKRTSSTSPPPAASRTGSPSVINRDVTSGAAINIPTGSRPFSAAESGHTKAKHIHQHHQQQLQLQATIHHIRASKDHLAAGSSSLLHEASETHPLDENPILTTSISDSFLNLSQVEEKDDDDDFPNLIDQEAEEVAKKAIQFTIRAKKDEKSKMKEKPKKKAITKPYNHYYYSAKQGKVTTAVGLKTLLSTKFQQLEMTDNEIDLQKEIEELRVMGEGDKEEANDELKGEEINTGKDLKSIRVPKRSDPSLDQGYLDFGRIPFDADAIENNPFGSKLQQKLQKHSPRPQSQPEPHEEIHGGDPKQLTPQHLHHKVLLDTPSAIFAQQQSIAATKLEVVSKPVFTLPPATINNTLPGPLLPVGESIDDLKSLKTSVPPAVGLSGLNEGSDSLYEKSSSIMLMSEVPHVPPKPHPGQLFGTVGQWKQSALTPSITSIDDYSTIPSVVGMKDNVGVTKATISPRLKESEVSLPTPVPISSDAKTQTRSHLSNLPFKQPQVPTKSRPTSSSANPHQSTNAISRTQKILQSNMMNGHSRPHSSSNPVRGPAVPVAPTVAPLNIPRPVHDFQTTNHPSQGARYYMPTIQPPLFSSEQDEANLPQQKLRVHYQEMSPIVFSDTFTPTSARSNTFSPAEDLSHPQSLHRRSHDVEEKKSETSNHLLTVAGQKANTSTNYREKVTNAVLSI